jgi:ABC-type transport system substrate-binding protein
MVEALDDFTIKITFNEVMPNPYAPLVGGQSPVLQAAQFADCLGAKAQECSAQNFNPIGTGPFKVMEFRTNDVIQLKANPNDRDPAQPALATMTFKGGGDADAAGRADLETGAFDYAWNLLLAPSVLAGMAAAGKGVPVSAFGTLVERIEMNMTNPSPNLPEGERSTAKHPHPHLSDVRLHKALFMAIDRNILVEVGYGQAGRPTCNLVPAPTNCASPNTDCMVQDIEGAKALLNEAGWVDRNFDGTDPQSYLAVYTCDKAPRLETQWQGENINRFCDPAYDALVAELGRTGDIAKRREIAIRLTEMLTKDTHTIVPLVDRGRILAHSNSLVGVILNTWDSELWHASDWCRIK